MWKSVHSFFAILVTLLNDKSITVIMNYLPCSHITSRGKHLPALILGSRTNFGVCAVLRFQCAPPFFFCLLFTSSSALPPLPLYLCPPGSWARLQEMKPCRDEWQGKTEWERLVPVETNEPKNRQKKKCPSFGATGWNSEELNRHSSTLFITFWASTDLLDTFCLGSCW